MRAKKLIQKVLANKDFVKALYKGSYEDKKYAAARLEEYAKMLSNQETFEQASTERFFSALTPGTATSRAVPGYGTVLQLASLLANVSSFSGFLTLEKALEQPNMVLHFLDIIGTNVRDRGAPGPKFPAVGATVYDNTALAMQSAALPGGTSFTLDAAAFRTVAGIPVGGAIPPILPYSIRIVVNGYDSSGNLVETEVIVDNGNGFLIELLSAPNISLSPNQLFTGGVGGYGNPTLPPGSTGWSPSFSGTPPTITASAPVASLEVTISFSFNYTEPVYYPGEQQDYRYTLDLTRVARLETKPSTLAIEMNRLELAAISKSLNQDLQPVLVQRLADIYNKHINRYIVRKYIQRFWPTTPTLTNPIPLDVGTPLGGPAGATMVPMAQYDQFIPVLDRTRGLFEAIRKKLHEQAFITNKITALLVTPKLAYWLARSIMVEQSLWVEEKIGYINDLFGYYIGIPVLIHTELTPLENQYETWARTTSGAPMDNSSNHVTAAIGFAISVLPENLAPMARGVFLPMTHTPAVANYNNPVQEALAVFFQEDVEEVARELVVPFAIVNMPRT